jgi:hypothetical protein
VGRHAANLAFSGRRVRFLGQSRPVPARPAAGESRLDRRQVIPAGPDRLPPAGPALRRSCVPPGPAQGRSRLGCCGASPIWAGAGAVPDWAGAPRLRLGLCPGERFLPPRGLGSVGPSRPFLLTGWAAPFPGPRWSRPPRPLPAFAWAASGQVYPAFAALDRPLPGT